MLDKLNPRESLGFLAWKVARLKTNDLAARFVEAGIKITVEQWRVLIPLYKTEGLTQGRLCELLSQEKTGVSRLVAALEKRGYVRREAGKDDRRVKYIHITDAGRDLMVSTVDMALANMGTREGHVDPEELAICKKVLWEIVAPTIDEGCFLQEEK
jgi:DNA-binding MarR family transcriptional regulator